MPETKDAQNNPEPATPEAAAGAAPEQAAAGEPGSATAETGGDDLVAKVAELEAELVRLDDVWKRAVAETENLRRRAAREKADERKYAMTQFARDVLPVADNLHRALQAIDPAARAADPALDALVVGVEMTAKVLADAFERHGVTPIPAEGERFDPHVHEAMFEVPDESVPAGTVVQVIEPGYRIHDRPLRPAKVGVARGGPKPAPSPAGGSRPEESASGAGTSPYDRSADASSGDGAGRRYDEKL